MSDPTADAYRLAADYLTSLDLAGGVAESRLRGAAERLDEESELANYIGRQLMQAATNSCGTEKLGALAVQLVKTANINRDVVFDIALAEVQHFYDMVTPDRNGDCVSPTEGARTAAQRITELLKP